jgi:hypothetical protein
MRNIPRLEIAIDGDVLMISHHRLTERGPLEVPIPLRDLFQLGKEDAEKKIGALVLNVLALWHNDAFERLEVDSLGSRPSPGLALINNLIAHSLTVKTRSYIATIEHILAHPTTCSEQEYVMFATDAWPVIKQELERYDAT